MGKQRGNFAATSRWVWLDYDEAESKQVRDFLSQDVEGEGVDALRIGASVRDRIAEQLFPGTSTQYTRLRYVILIPALLSKKGTTAGSLLQAQRAMNYALQKANPKETGVLGRRSPNRDFVHLYWTALRTWKFLEAPGGDARNLTVGNGIEAFQYKSPADEDGSAIAESRVVWHPTVVRLAEEFWKPTDTTGWPSINCRKEEAEFILKQWLDLPEFPPLAAIAYELAKRRPQSKVSYPWEVSTTHTNSRTALDRAKAVSLICWGAQLAYNFELLRKARVLESKTIETTWTRRNRDLNVTERQIADLFAEWSRALNAEKRSLGGWAEAEHWRELGTSSARTFLSQAASWLLLGKTDLKSSYWADWVCEREKVNPAPKLSIESNLAAWSGTPEMARRWDFRWNKSVSRFVSDAENALG